MPGVCHAATESSQRWALCADGACPVLMARRAIAAIATHRAGANECPRPPVVGGRDDSGDRK